MSNTDLKSRIETLIHEVETTHRYSMSRIYGLYNEAYEADEKPQSCASCLMRKVRELRLWLENQKEVEAVTGEDQETTPHQERTDLPEQKPKKTTRKKTDNAAEKN